ncbi:hypothetical protein [Chitinophaga sancti]|uniref:Uncharacterized protein n=1 Tax=Chitinophaga sancti TaxID=1004 RepID=A0A1K1SWF7_9BACT|nr:hypothetical protein [Chitinophaga sancti]WQD63118.1 hypothetical protein U0033_01830 [Chitinophaga sancti]WQG91257.1 hypothetical protein SR876_07085 [Chitinophaga sancti]SFW88666.1 hypothetical protein SAMN05661012_06291 [Chitinophaga sancti]
MNIPVAIITIAMVAMTMTACQSKQSPSIPEDDHKGVSTNNLLDKDTISVEFAKMYVKNYASRAGKIPVDPSDCDACDTESIDGRPHKMGSNTRTVWFSASRLKALVDQLEAEGGDGIRFYFASYDSTYNKYDSSHTHIPERPYWNRNTLVMVTTRDSTRNDSIFHWDYFNNDPRGTVGKGRIVLAAAENRGELCPPPATCKSVGALLITQ